MRLALAYYIKENQTSIYSSESNIDIGNLLPSAYITQNGYNFKAFIDDFLLAMHNEAEKIIIYLAPIVFNINMNLYILEGAGNVNKKFTFFKQYFPCLIGDNKSNNFSPTISLFYRFCHYDTFYSYQLIRESGDNITFSIYDNSKVVDPSIPRITIFAGLTCDICNRFTEYLIFSHMPGLSVCKLCLIDFVKQVILKRTNNYAKEFYNNKECKIIDD
jgi:hypothetical protein